MRRRSALAIAAVGLSVSAVAAARPMTFKPLCPDHSCKAQAAVDENGVIIHFSTPHGYGAPDLQTLFDVDPTLGAGKTVAVVDAYGYQELEADLAVYRAEYDLPPCTVASGCLTILNSAGMTSPLAPDSDMGWIGETALDVQMVSAACPLCNIIVVQTNGPGLSGLQVGQLVAAKQFVDAISDSWGGPEDDSVAENEGDYNNAGIATFVSTGDDGYAGGASYPATSAFTVAVGGIGMDPTTMLPIAWAGAGSACSAFIAKQPWTPGQAPCPMRAAADISAFANPEPGVASYVAALGGWMPIGGTSAAAPFSAALFTAAGHADARPGFVYKHPDAFTDVTMGSSGDCGSTLCNAVVGWDGPTGLGLPDQRKLAAIGNVAGIGPSFQVTYPMDGSTVAPGFTVQIAPDDATQWVEMQVDGMRVSRLGAPWLSTAPTSIAVGAHALTFIGYDIDHDSTSMTVNVTVAPDTGGGGGSGGCAAAGLPGAGALLGLFGLVGMRRRRRRSPR